LEERRAGGDLVELTRPGAGQLLPRRAGAAGRGAAGVSLVLAPGGVGHHAGPFLAMPGHRELAWIFLQAGLSSPDAS
jgi:hypothetical protein